MTSSKSFCVSATNAIERAPFLTRSRIHCAPASVLPKPRPARASHVRQSPSGANWFGRAQKRQSWSRRACASVLSFLSSASCCSGGSARKQSAAESICIALDLFCLNGAAVLAGVFDLVAKQAVELS